jgi:ketosteroid isomerase-like protein
MSDSSEVIDLVGRWWFNYDEGNFDVLTSLLTEDAHFTCRTDTGTTDYEEFVRADYRGRDAIMAWQTEHRLNSPYPLRHMGVNVHVTGSRDVERTFSSYLFVTHVVDGQIANLSTAIVTGAARVDGGEALLSALHVALDTQSSVVFRTR